MTKVLKALVVYSLLKELSLILRSSLFCLNFLRRLFEDCLNLSLNFDFEGFGILRGDSLSRSYFFTQSVTFCLGHFHIYSVFKFMVIFNFRS